MAVCRLGDNLIPLNLCEYTIGISDAFVNRIDDAIIFHAHTLHLAHFSLHADGYPYRALERNLT